MKKLGLVFLVLASLVLFVGCESESKESVAPTTPTVTLAPTATPTLVPTLTLEPTTPPSLTPTGEVKGVYREKARVSQVVDGDTIKLSDAKKVRYIGIDTPETKHPSKPQGCFGKEAAEKNRQLVAGKEVELEKDVSETDRYGRLLRYVYVDGQMVNLTLVKEGYAKATSYPPDVKYQDLFRQAEKEARQKQLGLWGKVCQLTPTPKKSIPTKRPTKKPINNSPQAGGAFTCDCNKTCSRMSSCKEAYFQLNQCGCTRRDKDGDGIPCESLCR